MSGDSHFVDTKLNPRDVTIALLERAWHWTGHSQLTFWDAMSSVTILNTFQTAPQAA